MIKRVKVVSGIAWASKNHWFWLSFKGDIYSFSLSLGRFGVQWERKDSW